MSDPINCPACNIPLVASHSNAFIPGFVDENGNHHISYSGTHSLYCPKCGVEAMSRTTSGHAVRGDLRLLEYSLEPKGPTNASATPQ